MTLSQVTTEENGNLKSNEKLRFSSINCLKALGAFFIICIHCFDLWYLFPIIRTAVPFFFIISGFFLYRDNPKDALDKCIATLKKIFWITLYANLFYYVCYYIPSDPVPFKNLESLIKYIIIGNKLGFHLWYLNAYIEALIVIIIALRLRVLGYLWFSIPFLIILGLILGKYAFLFPQLPNTTILSRNFITMGIPCVGIGWLIRKYSSQLLKIFSYPILLTIIILILSECEIVLLKFTGSRLLSGDYIITTIPLAASMVLIAVKYPFVGKNSLIEFVGKKYSTDIYIFHIFILNLFAYLNAKILNLLSFTLPFIVFVLTILFIILLQKISTKFLKGDHGGSYTKLPDENVHEHCEKHVSE
ncbi:MAG: acyltransferase [Paramuribaculum sp.]|nr:acyltransferase [Paramuribaculum sp.]